MGRIQQTNGIYSLGGLSDGQTRAGFIKAY